MCKYPVLIIVFISVVVVAMLYFLYGMDTSKALMLNTQRPKFLYKLVTKSQWEAMEQFGISYQQGSELDQNDGYLHMSTATQIERIAVKYFSTLENGKLIKLDYHEIESLLKWEPNSKGESFPHCYSPIPKSSVIAVYDFSIRDFDFSKLE